MRLQLLRLCRRIIPRAGIEHFLGTRLITREILPPALLQESLLEGSKRFNGLPLQLMGFGWSLTFRHCVLP